MPPRDDPFAEFVVSDSSSTAPDPFAEFAAPDTTARQLVPNTQLTANTPLRRFGRALPGVGSFLGGLAGGGVGPVSRAGAALGGGGGEAFNQLIQYGTNSPSQPQSSGEAAQRILTEGAIGAGSQLAGQGAARGAGMLGKSAFGVALGRQATQAINKRFGTRRFPYTAEKLLRTVLKERVPIDPKGAAALDRRVTTSTATKMRELTTAGNTGAVTHVEPILANVEAWRSRLQQKAVHSADLRVVDKMLTEARTNLVGNITPQRLDQVLSDAGELAYKQRDVDANSPIVRQFHRELAHGAEAELRRIAPRAARARRRTNDLMAAREAINAASQRPGNFMRRVGAASVAGGTAAALTPGGARERGGAGLATTAITTAALSRPGMSGLGMLLTSPLLQQLLLRGTPAAINSARALEGATRDEESFQQ